MKPTKKAISMKGARLMILRYYVQLFADGTYLVRERKHDREEIDLEQDRRIRPFDNKEDADFYAGAANHLQDRLDKRHGRWVKHAIAPGLVGVID